MNPEHASTRVAIRCDASYAIGTGHVMRCLTLAEQLRERGAEVTFVCRKHPGHINDIINERGYRVHSLPSATPESLGEIAEDVSSFTADNRTSYSHWLAVSVKQDAFETASALMRIGSVDWLVVDHYGLDERWEHHLRPMVRRIMAIDDLANRRHDCDLLLDQGYYANQQRYRQLVPPESRTLLGPEYALLRPEFLRARSNLRRRDGNVRRILLFFGGVDPTNETGKAVRAIQGLDRPDLHVDVVVGAANRRYGSIHELCVESAHLHFHRGVDNMAELMAAADLSLGGGGVTTWERCYLGLPAIVLIMADNQRLMVESLSRKGALVNAGWHDILPVEKLRSLVFALVAQPRRLKTIGSCALRLMGNENRQAECPVAETMMELEYATA